MALRPLLSKSLPFSFLLSLLDIIGPAHTHPQGPTKNFPLICRIAQLSHHLLHPQTPLFPTSGRPPFLRIKQPTVLLFPL